MDIITEPTIEEWQSLFDVAIEFKKLNSWDWMYDNDIFGVQNPFTGEIGYCSILGNLGEFFGIILYQGTEGLEFLSNADSFEPGDPELIFMQKGLMLSFGPREDLTNKELKIIKELGLKFRGKTAWPLFKNHTPGYFPWSLNSEECRYMTLALKQIINVVIRCKDDKSILHTPSSDNLFVRKPVKDGDAYLWQDEYIVPEPYEKKFNSFNVMDEIRIKRIKDKKTTKTGIWEVDTFYTPAPVKDEKDERPYYPKICICVDSNTGLVLNMHMISNIEKEGYEFIESFLELTETLKQVPRTLLVAREETYALFNDIAKKLNINLKMVDNLDFADQARFDMYEFMDMED